jgi:riboflavin synthase alpha subunit
MGNQIIKCKESGCDQIFVNPCKEIVSLFSAMINPDESKDTDYLTSHENRKNLSEKGIVGLDGVSVHISDNKKLSISVKYLTLQCSKKHRHQYFVECK